MVLDMYSNYFGLEEPPFSIAPNPRYLYLSKQHREALAHLLYGIGSNGGFVLLTGEVGTGKTTVCRALLDQLPETTDVALVLNPKYTSEELLAAICDELGIAYTQTDASIKSYIDALNNYLLESHAKGRNTVLILDEAQNLGVDVLEQIRLLTNLETDCSKLLQIILVGQPELLEQLQRTELRQLSQRITARFHIGALSRNELEAYINHRLSVAGVQGRLFPAATLNRLYRMTKGIPRLINILCDRALLGAFVERQNRVEVNVLKKAASEVLGNEKNVATASWLGSFQRLVLIMLVVLLGGFFVAGFKVPELNWMEWLGDDASQAQAVDIIDTEAIPEAVLSPPAELNTDQLGQWSWSGPEEYKLNQVLAYRALFEQWGINYQPRQHPIVCKYARSLGYACLFGGGKLETLLQLNRPAVLKLKNASGEAYFATMISVHGKRIDLIIDDRPVQVSLAELQRRWLSSYTLFWLMPPGYDGVIQPGVRSGDTYWLDQQLATIQGRQARRSNNLVYDKSLVAQVKQFQKTKGLLADGIVGPKTSIHLNTATGQSVPLLIPTGMR